MQSHIRAQQRLLLRAVPALDCWMRISFRRRPHHRLILPLLARAVTSQSQRPGQHLLQQQQPQQKQRQKQQQQQQQRGLRQRPGRPAGLGWQALQRAAQVAAWSGLTYLPPEQLGPRLVAAGLTLVAHGRCSFTAWFVADGCISHQRFLEAAHSRGSSSTGSGSTGGGTGTTSGPAAAATAEAAMTSLHGGSGGNSSDGGESAEGAARVGQRERFVFFRGVQWSAPDLDALRLSQRLARVWPVPFAAKLTHPPGALVAHEGVSEMATAMFDQLRPYLDQAADVQLPVAFAGHSMGGSLALLVMALARLSNSRHLPDHLSCHMFGSPLVLAHERGGGATAVLTQLRLPGHAVRGFALEHDPVPRALISADPAFAAAKQWGAVRGLLALRGLLLGDGSPLSTSRFLFEPCGEVHLIKWTPADGTQVLPLEAHEVEEGLTLGPNSVFGRLDPVSSVRAWLDHHHGSYAQELEAAAAAQLRLSLQRQGYGR